MTTAYDRQMAHESYLQETACVECGYHRLGGHHPKIRCPLTKRCGDCGAPWPCAEHRPKQLRSLRHRWRPTGQDVSPIQYNSLIEIVDQTCDHCGLRKLWNIKDGWHYKRPTWSRWRRKPLKFGSPKKKYFRCVEVPK